jgi:hypothetical protein
MGSKQTRLGAGLLLAGVVWLISAWNMGTSVRTGGEFIGDTYIPSRSVVNLDKQDTRRNHLLLASLLTLSGVIFLSISATKGTAPVESSGAKGDAPSTSAPPCDRDLTLDAYKIWLVSKYKITKNEVLGGVVCHETLFGTTEEALAHAHALEMKTISDDLAQQEKAAIDDEAAKERASREAYAAESRKRMLGIVLFLGAMVFFIGWLSDGNF